MGVNRISRRRYPGVGPPCVIHRPPRGRESPRRAWEVNYLALEKSPVRIVEPRPFRRLSEPPRGVILRGRVPLGFGLQPLSEVKSEETLWDWLSPVESRPLMSWPICRP